jgi:hypothetical protein
MYTCRQSAGAAPALSLASAAESPRHKALVHSLSTDSALPWQPTLLADPRLIVSTMHGQNSAPALSASEATSAEVADSATPQFCMMYMLLAAVSRGVLHQHKSRFTVVRRDDVKKRFEVSQRLRR